MMNEKATQLKLCYSLLVGTMKHTIHRLIPFNGAEVADWPDEKTDEYLRLNDTIDILVKGFHLITKEELIWHMAINHAVLAGVEDKIKGLDPIEYLTESASESCGCSKEDDGESGTTNSDVSDKVIYPLAFKMAMGRLLEAAAFEQTETTRDLSFAQLCDKIGIDKIINEVSTEVGIESIDLMKFFVYGLVNEFRNSED